LVNRLKVLTGQQPVSRILIIDDDAGDRFVLKQQLKDFSFLIMEAATALRDFGRLAKRPRI
jgi:hypothetical protein